MAAEKLTDEEREYALLLSDVREVLKQRGGKDVIWFILSLCGLYSESFTGNSQTFHMEGKRSIGLQILQLLEDADPTAYARLLLYKQESKKK